MSKQSDWSVRVTHVTNEGWLIALHATPTAQDSCKLADFGLAKNLSKGGAGSSGGNALVGTLGYLAPETMFGKRFVNGRCVSVAQSFPTSFCGHLGRYIKFNVVITLN